MLVFGFGWKGGGGGASGAPRKLLGCGAVLDDGLGAGTPVKKALFSTLHPEYHPKHVVPMPSPHPTPQSKQGSGMLPAVMCFAANCSVHGLR